jgi:hypothetical protein
LVASVASVFGLLERQPPVQEAAEVTKAAIQHCGPETNWVAAMAQIHPSLQYRYWISQLAWQFVSRVWPAWTWLRVEVEEQVLVPAAAWLPAAVY